MSGKVIEFPSNRSRPPTAEWGKVLNFPTLRVTPRVCLESALREADDIDKLTIIAIDKSGARTVWGSEQCNAPFFAYAATIAQQIALEAMAGCAHNQFEPEPAA